MCKAYRLFLTRLPKTHMKHTAGFGERQMSRKEHARPVLASQKVLLGSRKMPFAKRNRFFLLKYVGMVLLIYRSSEVPLSGESSNQSPASYSHLCAANNLETLIIAPIS